MPTRCPRRPRLPWTITMLGLVALVAAACGSPPAATPSPEPRLTVVTTVYPLQFLAQRVGGERVHVVNLTPAGAEPHDWEPSPRDITTLQQAHIFAFIGAGFEPWVARTLASMGDGGPAVFEATHGLELPENGAGHAAEGEDEEHNDGHEDAGDPHVWLDPLLLARQAHALAELLAQADPQGREAYQANRDRLAAELEALHREYVAGLEQCRHRTIVVAHAAFGHLAQRYGLEQVGIAGLSPEVEPSPARMREVTAMVRELGVTHIFFETLVSPAVAQTIAREVGAQTLPLDPLEGLSSAQLQAGADYFSVMRENLANLRTALQCQ